MGGKPNPGTSKDMRLKRNNPSAGNTPKSKVTQAAQPTKPAAPKKTGGKS